MSVKKSESKVVMERSDPANYRAMSEPFGSVALANDAIKAFFDELGELRRKHKLADVHVIVAGNMTNDDGREGQFILNGHWGDSTRGEAMTAWAFGREQVERQQRVHEYMAAADVIERMHSSKGKR